MAEINKDNTTKLLDTLKADTETQIKQVRSGWVYFLMNFKITIRTVVGDSRTSIYNVEAKQTSSALTIHVVLLLQLM